MDEFTGSVKEFIGLFKIPKTDIPVGNLYQQTCNASKAQFDETNGDCSLYGLDFPKAIEGKIQKAAKFQLFETN